VSAGRAPGSSQPRWGFDDDCPNKESSAPHRVTAASARPRRDRASRPTHTTTRASAPPQADGHEHSILALLPTAEPPVTVLRGRLNRVNGIIPLSVDRRPADRRHAK